MSVRKKKYFYFFNTWVQFKVVLLTFTQVCFWLDTCIFNWVKLSLSMFTFTSVRFLICQNLLNFTQVHWNQYRSCVRNVILPHNFYYIAVCCVYTVNSMWIFCMHGMPGLPATLAEIWCMHLKTLRGILFPRTQRAPCDVSSSNAWVNWRRGIVIINVTLVNVRI